MSEKDVRLTALRRVVDEVEIGSSRLGWDQPPALYALVSTGELLATDDLPEDIAEGIRASWDGTSLHFTAILQESLSDDQLEEALPRLAWPDSVAGVAVSVERIIVPPEVDAAAPEDPEEALQFINEHPARSEVRLTVGVLRGQVSWCEIRTKAFDQDTDVIKGKNLVPQLVELIEASLSPDQG